MVKDALIVTASDVVSTFKGKLVQLKESDLKAEAQAAAKLAEVVVFCDKAGTKVLKDRMGKIS